jgi:heme A synthase
MREVITGAFFIFIFLTGFGMRRAQKPFPGLLRSIHELLGLAAVVFLGITIYQSHQASPLDPLETVASLVTFLLFALTITTGSLTAIERPMPAVIPVLHKLLPYLTVLSTALTLYFIISGG